MTNPAIQSTPVLQTERLVLRAHTAADYDESAAMWADPEVTRHIGGRPSTAEEAWSRVLRYGGLWTLLGFGYWVARERETGRFVGEVGFADFRREMKPPVRGAPEVGWALAPWAHGRGFATEAVRAALAWGDAHLPADRAVCIIGPANTASIRVAEKCGFREIGPATYKGEPTVLYERRRG
jgi:RimJ/RimL family protein N-acetyltransferase